ncbi:protein mono-ADP-ribosyltransferase PARP14 isoform X2 [Sorex araneus]|uniref:protein mono-ADP-ribosyltransferase PARP14 isoform X2 n=1 Tax=Sorex araneus TaxID=42254 RepID=UPI0024334199|nr:protein mono-ADP-ribosyltransferase PARP14 isoform X2 [Sorex araneus]
MAAPGSFPLLVEGSWGPDPPRNLSTKLQLYFQSPRRSGGGECEVCPCPGSPGRFLVLFSPEDVRQKVLERQNHELAWPGNGPFKLTLKLPTVADEVHDEEQITTKESKSKDPVKQPDVTGELDTTHSVNRRPENIEDTPKEPLSSLVVFENLKNNVNDIVLTLLVENVSGLSSGDFHIEIIQDFKVAVVTFHKNLDIIKFVGDCAQNNIANTLQLSPRLLETTKIIKVENLPPGMDAQTLEELFENPQNGGGRVACIKCFPEESSALIEFFDRKVLDTVLTKKFDLDNVQLSVFPYYTSLGTALYGKEKPLIKLPAPFRESLDHLLWKFLQKNNYLIREINDEMAHCHCELTWSQLNGEVTIRPAATLVNQGRKKIKTWQQDASIAFSDLRSRYKIASFKVAPIMWDTIKNSVKHDCLSIEFDSLMELVILVGRSEDIEDIESHVKELIQSTTEQIKRAEQNLEEKLTISLGKYSLLHESRTLEVICTKFPEIKTIYDDSTQHMYFQGPQADVQKVKCEIQEKVSSMTQKNIQVPPEIFQFLQQVNCIEFSRSLFIAQKILAFYELRSTSVLLTSCSSVALVEAEKQMMSTLNYKCIEVEDRKVFHNKKWKELISNLQDYNSSSSKCVIIHDITPETAAKVIIAGCVGEVNQVHKSLLDFLETQTIIKKLFEVKPSLVFYYLKSEKKLFWQQLNMKNVQVQFNSESFPKSILLTGPKSQVEEGMKLLKRVRDSVCVRSIQIDKPGTRQFFQEKARFYKSEVKRLFGCFVELQKNKEREDGGSDGQKWYLRTDVAPGVLLVVQQGILTQFPVEVVVNVANEDLKHVKGLAAALSKAAGPELQRDCDRIVKSQGKILPGCATISKAGNLPYGHVIHAVGPRWEKDKAQDCAYTLRRAVQKSLRLAEDHKYRSIAIPAIRPGALGFPLPQSMEAVIWAIMEYFHFHSEQHSLKEIYLIDAAEKTVEAFAETVETEIQDTLPGPASQPHVRDAVPADLRKDHGNRQILWAPGGLKVLMVKGDIQSANTDVVVNSISSDLELNQGPLSRALLKSAGPELQKELNRAGKTMTVNVGTVLQTCGCNLPCRYVLHVVAASWRNDNSHKIMEGIIRKCLEVTESLSLNSITFPAIGTGNLGFPKKVFAELILSEVVKFSSKNQTTTLQEVHLLLQPSDHENIQAFSDVFAQKATGNFPSDKIFQAADAQGFCGMASSPNKGAHQMKIGPIIFQVATGDITKEEADVIVNSTSDTFNLKAGVSKAILESAGKEVEVQCSLQAQKSNSGFIVTEGGLLRCKNIVHIIAVKDVKSSVSCAMQECEKRNYSSICLPAIGTEQANQDPVKVAEAIIDAIEDFIRKGSVRSMKKVKVVLFQPQLLEIFYASMKKREGPKISPRQSISKIASHLAYVKQFFMEKNPSVLEKQTELAVLQVCGDNVKHVESALSWIQNLIIKEQYSYISEDEGIKDFDEKECQELYALQMKLRIVISLDNKKPFIEVCGISRDVMEARNKSEEMIRRVRSDKEQDSQADCLSEFIEWKYNNNIYYPFDKITNMQLEEARKTKEKKMDVKIKHQTYTVDLTTYTATNAVGDTLPIQRFKKAEVEIPSHWSDMKQQNICVVDLPPSHAEYKEVARQFNKTCSNFVIEKIERIQNLDLWKSYQVQKKTMTAKNGNRRNETQLFRGTDEESVPLVNMNGFNCSHAEKNAALYGKGTYFAVNASYSADDTYSKPDAKGKKYMYYVRVLTGIYTSGNSSLIVPPPKDPQNPADRYDTVTDNVQNPNLFVVFYDYQAYPEYLITFTE